MFSTQFTEERRTCHGWDINWVLTHRDRREKQSLQHQTPTEVQGSAAPAPSRLTPASGSTAGSRDARVLLANAVPSAPSAPFFISYCLSLGTRVLQEGLKAWWKREGSSKKKKKRVFLCFLSTLHLISCQRQIWSLSPSLDFSIQSGSKARARGADLNVRGRWNHLRPNTISSLPRPPSLP